MEPGEDVLTCARREVLEESGLSTMDFVFRGTVLWTGFGTARRDYLCFIFRADTFTGTAHDGNEEGTLEWAQLVLSTVTGLSALGVATILVGAFGTHAVRAKGEVPSDSYVYDVGPPFCLLTRTSGV